MSRKIPVTALFFFILPCFSLFPQSINPFFLPEKEAPTAIFQTEIADADVDLFLFGSWEAQLTASFGFAFPDNGAPFPMIYPGMEPGFFFKQIPDLTISLWLLKRYFFEATILEDYENNTFLLGYQGKEGELLQSIRLGNTDLGIDEYGLMTIPEAPITSLGGAARFETPKSSHELLLRYDPVEKRSKTFLGKNEVIEETIELPSYVRGKYFILPDNEVEDVTIYIEAASGSYADGTGKTYRIAGNEEVILNSEEGFVTLKEPAAGRVLAFYRKNGSSVGDPALGRGFLSGLTGGQIDPAAAPVDFDFGAAYTVNGIAVHAYWSTTINGGPAILLHDPRRYSPFELLNRYTVDQQLPEENWRSRVSLLSKGNLNALGEELSAGSTRGDSDLAVYGAPGSTREIKNRYPFVSTYPELYGPGRETRESRIEDFISIRVLFPAEGYFLEPNVIPGSVSVKRNGRRETNFTVQYESGTVEFLGYIHPLDRITIEYQTVGVTQGGDIVFGFGNRLTITPDLFLDLALGIRWNILSGTFSVKEGQHPGSVLATAALDYSSEMVDARVDTGLSLSTPDTTGIFRILGMEGEGLQIPVSDGNIFPASPSSTFLRENRGFLYYKDFRSYSVLGGATLKEYTWEPPADQIYPYATGSRPGPYTAMPDTGVIDGEIMVLEYDLESGEWAGGLVPLMQGDDEPDLSRFDSISFYWKSLDTEGTVDVHFQIGSVNEDLDGDGQLDREDSIYSRGFSFNDSANSAVLLVGGGPDLTGNRTLDSEDMNGNGILDVEDGDYVVDSGAKPLPGENWKIATLTFTEAEKKQLIKSRAFRIMIEETGAANASGKLLISGLTVNGSPFSRDPASSVGTDEINDKVNLREIPESFSAIQPPELLVSVYPEAQEIFHPQDIEQRVLEASWDSTTGSGGNLLIIKGYTAPVPLFQYRKLSMYLRLPQLASPGSTTVTVSLKGSDGGGVEAVLTPPQFSDWRKLEIDLVERSVTLGGEPLPGSTVTLTGTGGTFSIFSITLDGSTSGTFYLDEVHCEESAVSLGFGAMGSVEYRRPGKLFFLPGLDILSDIRILQEAAFSTNNFAAGYIDDGTPLTTRSYTEFEGTLLYTRLKLEMGILYTEPDLFLSGGHSLTVPAVPSPVVFTDSFSQRDDPGGITMSRSNSLDISLPGGNNLLFLQDASLFPPTLTQDWSLAYSTDWSIPLSLQLDGSLGNAVENWTLFHDNYFVNWILGYSLYAPAVGDDAPERRSKNNLSLKLTTLPVGFTTGLNLGYSVSGNQNRLHTSSGSFSLSLPLRFAQESPSQWSITPGYERSFTYAAKAGKPGNYSDDFSRLGSGFAAQEYIYNTWPLADLFSNRAETLFIESSAGYDSAGFTPLFFIDYSRRYGSNLYDLFLPSMVSLKFSRNLSRRSSSLEDSYTFSGELNTSGINLFGAQGAYRLTSLFDSDEYNSSVFLSVTSEDNFFFKDVELILQHFFAFYKADTHRFTLENRFARTWSDVSFSSNRTNLGFLWSIFPKKPIVLPVFRETLKEGYLRNGEYLDWLLEPFSQDKSKYGFSLLFRHETALVFPAIGDITAHLSVGFDRMLEELSILGFQIGLAAKFQF